MTIKVSSKTVEKDLSRLEKFFSSPPKGIMGEIGSFAIFKIQARTDNSRDYLNRPFEPYSFQYLFTRIDAGRPTKVDLFFTGKMSAAMTYKQKGKDKIILFFSSAEESKKAFYNNRLREFFGLNKTDLKQIKKIYLDGIKES